MPYRQSEAASAVFGARAGAADSELVGAEVARAQRGASVAGGPVGPGICEGLDE